MKSHIRWQRALALVLILIGVVATIPTTTPTPIVEAQSLPWRDKGTPFGVVATLGNRVREDEIPQAIQLMREAGVQWQREEIFWDQVQKEPNGPFRWDGNGNGFYNYDYAIGAQVAAGINVLGLLDYNPAWFKGRNPTPEEWIEDWGDFVYAAVARYGRERGWVKYWELWNEPNLEESGYQSGLYTPQDFVRVLQVGYAAAKAADPEARIVMGGLVSIWSEPPSPYNYDYLTYLSIIGNLGAWNYVDIIAIHPYRPDPPEGEIFKHKGTDSLSLRDELRLVDELLLKHGPKPIWLTEMGWPSHHGAYSVSEDDQAFFLVRTYILAISHPSVEKIFWYDLRNDTAPDALYHRPYFANENPQFHYGMVRRTYPLDVNDVNLRKPAMVAYRTMTNMLAGLWLNNVLAENDRPDWPGVYWYRFTSDARRVDVLWRTESAVPVKQIACGCREALVRNWNGDVEALIYTYDGNISLRLNDPGAPVYVEYDPRPASDGEYFEITGHTIRGTFRDFWYGNGGLARFGYPLTEELLIADGGGRPRVVQYFERARFEHYPESSNPNLKVVLSRIGETMLRRQGIDWTKLPRIRSAPDTCRFFADIGHAICPPFLEVWERYGGLEGIGYPLTEPYPAMDKATNTPYTIQHFERARLEYYPNKNGQAGVTEFGMLGREYLVLWGGVAAE